MLRSEFDQSDNSYSNLASGVSAAAVTTTALTVAVVPDSDADKSRDELLRLLADIRPFGTNPQAIPDLTGGLGSAGYTVSQETADQLLRLTDDNANGAEAPGINIVTTGPLFALLSLFGVDYGRVPALPNSIADEINGTPIWSLIAPESKACSNPPKLLR